MQLIYTNKKIMSVTVLIGLLLLLLPLFFVAAETSIYQEVITSSNSGGQSSDRNTIKQGGATIEIQNTTIIDGKESSYYFSTSTSDAAEHQVTIIDDTPALSKTNLADDTTGDKMSVEEYEKYEALITRMINLLNYLQLYATKNF